MRVLISGATGLVGSALEAALREEGATSVRLTRSPRLGSTDVGWDPAAGTIEGDRLGQLDAVVHLAGESIGSGRWTAVRKERLVRSRLDATRLLVGTLAALPEPPRTLISVSASGYYGDRGNEVLTDRSSPGTDFLATLAVEWESEALRASSFARVAVARLGLVLSLEDGALARMLPPFRLGLGGRMGTGRQWWSWVSLNDATRALAWLLSNRLAEGPWNVVGGACTNAEFTRSLGRALHRPTFLSIPGPILRIALGEMADALLLASQRVQAVRFAESGFVFRDAELGATFKGLVE